MTQSLIERSTYTVIPDPNGQFIPYRDWGGYEWRGDTPDRPDSLAELRWPIVAEYPANKRQFVYYFDGRFRSSGGGAQSTPMRWFYLRLQPEVWHPVWQQWVLPGITTQPVPVPVTPSKPGVHLDDVAGQQLIDILKRSFTTKQIQDFMDASPYNEPDTGAPQTPGAMG